MIELLQNTFIQIWLGFGIIAMFISGTITYETSKVKNDPDILLVILTIPFGGLALFISCAMLVDYLNGEAFHQHRKFPWINFFYLSPLITLLLLWFI